jgi:hypothetical protein
MNRSVRSNVLSTATFQRTSSTADAATVAATIPVTATANDEQEGPTAQKSLQGATQRLETNSETETTRDYTFNLPNGASFNRDDEVDACDASFSVGVTESDSPLPARSTVSSAKDNCMGAPVAPRTPSSCVLPTGQVMDAKNTLQSFSVLVVAPQDGVHGRQFDAAGQPAGVYEEMEEPSLSLQEAVTLHHNAPPANISEPSMSLWPATNNAPTLPSMALWAAAAGTANGGTGADSAPCYIVAHAWNPNDSAAATMMSHQYTPLSPMAQPICNAAVAVAPPPPPLEWPLTKKGVPDASHNYRHTDMLSSLPPPMIVADPVPLEIGGIPRPLAPPPLSQLPTRPTLPGPKPWDQYTPDLQVYRHLWDQVSTLGAPQPLSPMSMAASTPHPLNGETPSMQLGHGNNDQGNHSSLKALPRWLRYSSVFALVMVAMAVLTTAVLLGVLCDSNGCQSPTSDYRNDPTSPKTTATEQHSPTSSPAHMSTLDPKERRALLTAYINSITLSNRSIRLLEMNQSALAAEAASPEELALWWLAYIDPLSLAPDTGVGQFRLQQRYALATLWMQPGLYASGLQPLDNNDESECSWYGIECTSMYLGESIGVQDVITNMTFFPDLEDEGVFLPEVKFYLPADLGLLSSLIAVDFCHHTELYGTLPESLGLWTNLTSFSAGNNRLTGSLPSTLNRWSNIEVFSVETNYLTGSLPEGIGNWTQLLQFYVAFNRLNGTIPASFGSWTNLNDFYVDTNTFSGSIPRSLRSWTSLEYFSAKDNHLTGTIPSWVATWTDLTGFDVGRNSFSGTLPDSIGQLTSLLYFVVPSNQLKGTLHGSVQNWDKLIAFDATNNSFVGSLPEAIGLWTAMTFFSVGNNDLSGAVPPSIANWTWLEEATFSINSLTGAIPESLCRLAVIYADCPLNVECACCTCT